VPEPRERFARLNSTLLPLLPALVKEWLPAGRAAGPEWTALNPRRHDTRPGSFRVNLDSGRWADFATGERGGDPVSLYAYLFTNGRQGVAARELDSGGSRFAQVGPAKVAKVAKPDADEARRLARAGTIYAAAGPIEAAAEAYLRQRGLKPGLAWASLRAARLPYPHANVHPALIAPVTGPDGALEGIQRTFLTADGHKLPVRDPKLSLGRVRGGAIRLADPAAELVLCEGLEDGLSLAQELPGACVWVAPGAGMLAAMCLPPCVERVTIAADNDAAGEQAALRAAERFASEGRQVRIMRPDPAFKDWNDQLRGIARA
jgi:DNA primase